VDCGNDESLDITDAITIEAWVKPQYCITNFGRLAAKVGDSPPRQGWGVFTNKDHTNFKFEIFKNGEQRVAEHNYELPTDSWTHLVWTYDGYKAVMYWNGTVKFIKDWGSFLSIGKLANPLYISHSSFYFNGYLDDVRIYNRALSAGEIQYLYTKTQGRYK